MKKAVLVLLSLSVLLVACSFELTTDMYIQDVMDVEEFGDTLYTNATLALESSSDAERKQQIISVLEEELREPANFREEERSYSTYLVVDYKIPIVAASEVEAIYTLPEVRDNMFTFAVVSDALYVAFNKARFDNLDASLYEQFYQHLDFEDFTMNLYIRNDARDAVELTLYSVYANTVPVPYSHTIVLERRDDVGIRFSDVLKDSVTTPLSSETTGITVRKFADLNSTAE